MIDVGAIGQKYVGNGPPVLVAAVSLERDFFPKSESRGGLLGSFAVGLALLRAVDAIESNTFRVLVMQDFDGVAVEDGYDFSDKRGPCTHTGPG